MKTKLVRRVVPRCSAAARSWRSWNSVQVSDDELRLLANARAQAAKDWLVETGKIAAERVFIAAPKTGSAGMPDKGKASRADFSLR